MKKSYPIIIAFGILLLFFIQMAGTLVESIYILDLLNTSLDAKALGLLFFFTPVLLIPFRKKIPGWMVWLLFGFLFFSRGMTPYLNTVGRLVVSGVGTGTSLLLFPLLLTAAPKRESRPQAGLEPAVGLALAVGLSALLRTLNFTLDISLTPAGSWIGGGLGLLLGGMLTQMDWRSNPPTQEPRKGVTSAVFGIILTLTLVYFAFSAPGVIARWTGGNYAFIVTTVSLLALGWAFLAVSRPGLFERVSRRGLVIWNLLFTLALVGTTLARRVPFPPTPDAPPVVVGPPTWIQQIPLVLMLLLFPVIFLDIGAFSRTIWGGQPGSGDARSGHVVGEPGSGAAGFHEYLHQRVGLCRTGQPLLPGQVLAALFADWGDADPPGVGPPSGGGNHP